MMPDFLHRHHWMLDEADWGTCRRCGASRPFTNRKLWGGTFNTRPGRPYRPPSVLSDAEVEERLEVGC